MMYLYNTQHIDVNGVVELPMPEQVKPFGRSVVPATIVTAEEFLRLVDNDRWARPPVMDETFARGALANGTEVRLDLRRCSTDAIIAVQTAIFHRHRPVGTIHSAPPHEFFHR